MVTLVILICSRRLRSIPAAGLVIGMASGMGFATLELGKFRRPTEVARSHLT